MSFQQQKSNKTNKMFLGSILVIFAAMMWGLDGVLLTPLYFSKFNFFDVNFIVFIAHAIPTLILSIFFHKEYKKIRNFTRSDFLFLILIALFGGTIGTLSIVKSLELSGYQPFSIVLLIQKTQPIFAILLSIVILKERPSKKFFVIMLIALISIYVMTFQFKSPTLLPKNNLLAVCYSLLAAFSFGSSTVFGKKIVHKFTFLTSTFYRFFFTTFITFFFVIFSGKGGSSFKQYLHSPNVIFLSIFISFWGLMAILIYYYGLKYITASMSTFCELAFPLTSVFAEAIFLGKMLSPIQSIAALVLVLSILYLNLGKVEIKTIDDLKE